MNNIVRVALAVAPAFIVVKLFGLIGLAVFGAGLWLLNYLQKGVASNASPSQGAVDQTQAKRGHAAPMVIRPPVAAKHVAVQKGTQAVRRRGDLQSDVLFDAEEQSGDVAPVSGNAQKDHLSDAQRLTKKRGGPSQAKIGTCANCFAIVPLGLGHCPNCKEQFHPARRH